MSGPECRRAYHGLQFWNCPESLLIHRLSGVPRILEDTLPPHLHSESVNDPDWKVYEEYMSTTRINVNVRQVFPRGFSPGNRYLDTC